MHACTKSNRMRSGSDDVGLQGDSRRGLLASGGATTGYADLKKARVSNAASSESPHQGQFQGLLTDDWDSSILASHQPLIGAQQQPILVTLHVSSSNLVFQSRARTVGLPIDDLVVEYDWSKNSAVRLAGPNFKAEFSLLDPSQFQTLVGLLPRPQHREQATEEEETVADNIVEHATLRNQPSRASYLVSSSTRKLKAADYKLPSYALQQQAFDALDSLTSSASHGDDDDDNNLVYLVISEQCPSTGSRSFIVADAVSYFNYYMAKTPTLRHAFEIIREGCSSRLYLDLEFANPSAGQNGNFLVDKVLLAIARVARDQHGKFLRRSDFLELDSTTNEKFSRHVICPQLVFDSNLLAGALVKQAVDRLRMAGEVAAADMVDLSVYSKNRAFRMVWSSKFGKRKILEPALTNKFPCNDEDNCFQLFLDSLVCPNGARRTGLSLSSPASALAQELPPQSRALASYSSIAASCPYPALQAWILSLASQQAGGTEAGIRFCRMSLDGTSLMFGISKARFCANIGRVHKSNHVFFTVDLERQVARQGCTDGASCKGFLSLPICIPTEVLSSINLASPVPP